MKRTFMYLHEAWDFIDQIVDRVYEIVDVCGGYEVRWQ